MYCHTILPWLWDFYVQITSPKKLAIVVPNISKARTANA
jgi:hypothetical protein